MSTHLSVRDKVLYVLLFPGYYDYGERLTARITESFGEALVIQNVITQPDELKTAGGKADLVISAVPIPIFSEIPCVCVNPFMTERDFARVRVLTDKPIPWGTNAVNIVLLFSVNRESRSLFYDIFDNLIVLLLEAPNKTKVLACDTHEASVETVIGCL